MDLNTALITGAGTVLCGVLVAIIFIFGFKEKTFEEALDEQRSRGELLELIRGDKGRPKKPKKAGKKAKEKPATSETKSSSEAPRQAEADTVDKPSHVEFKFPEAEVVSERPPAQLPQDDSRKKRKRDRVKPILHNKEEHSPLAEDSVEPPPANHFAEIKPKDDVLLKRRPSREEGSSPSSEEIISEPEEPVAPPPKIAKPEKVIKAAPTTKVNGTKPGAGKVALNSEAKVGVGKLALNTPVPVIQPPVMAPVVMASASVVAAPPMQIVAPVVVKDRKKKKGDLASLQQMISKDAEGVTMSLLLPLVRKAELSRSEVHQLIEQLLNREQGGEHEWVEGRQDPVARLKKQLADKERALAEEQQGAQAVQAKLLELRAELNGERQRQGAMQRQLEDQLSLKQNELQALTARLQLANETHNKSLATAQQAQTQLSEERKKVRKLTEEKAAAQGSMSQEMEAHIQTLTKHHQEEVNSLQSQMTVVQSQVADLQSRLQEQVIVQKELRGEVSVAQELALQREQECDQLQQQLTHLESQLRLLKDDAASVKSAKETELEEAYRVQTELQLRVRSLEADVKRAAEETQTLSSQLDAARKASAANSSAKTDISDQTNKISQLESIIRDKDDAVSKLQAETQQHNTDLSQLKDELEAQRQKNNELRTKNWKAMEAVASAEKNLESKQKECDRLASNSASSVREEEQAAVRELLQRIFPSVSTADTKDHAVWVEKFEKAAEEWLSSELSSASEQQQQQTSAGQDESTQHVLAEVEKQNSQLQAMVTHYKTIIEDTEGMLNKLERHVEQEEARWRRQLQLKDEELEKTTAERDSLRSSMQQDDQQHLTAKAEELEVALTVLKGQLQTEEQQRSSGEARAKQLQTRLDELVAQVSDLEQVKKERDTLAIQLAKESSRSQQLERELEEVSAAHRGGTHNNHLDPTKAKDQTNATTNGPSSEPAISESGSAKK